MDTIDTQSWMCLGIVALVMGTAVGGWVFYARQRMAKLRRAFALEYTRVANQLPY